MRFKRQSNQQNLLTLKIAHTKVKHIPVQITIGYNCQIVSKKDSDNGNNRNIYEDIKQAPDKPTKNFEPLKSMMGKLITEKKRTNGTIGRAKTRSLPKRKFCD